MFGFIIWMLNKTKGFVSLPDIYTDNFAKRKRCRKCNQRRMPPLRVNLRRINGKCNKLNFEDKKK